MHIMSRKLLTLIEKGKHEKKFKNREIPEFTEENFHQIFNVAREMKISWPYLLNVKFYLKSIGFKKYKTRIRFVSGGSKNLLLSVYTSHGDIVLELEKKKFDAWTPSEDLKEINYFIRTYGDTFGNHNRF